MNFLIVLCENLRECREKIKLEKDNASPHPYTQEFQDLKIIGRDKKRDVKEIVLFTTPDMSCREIAYRVGGPERIIVSKRAKEHRNYKRFIKEMLASNKNIKITKL